MNSGAAFQWNASLELRRKAWLDAAQEALANCAPQDAAQLCAACLSEIETGGPVMGDLLGTVAGDAAIWADCAPVHELAAYAVAALDRLRGARLGVSARKRLFAELWQTFDDDDRQAFISRVDAEGRFIRKGDA